MNQNRSKSNSVWLNIGVDMFQSLKDFEFTFSQNN